MNYNGLIDALKKWEHLGVKPYLNGDVAYGKPFKNKGWGWLHQVAASIDDKLIAGFEKDNPFTQNYRHIKALYQCNGVNLFSGGLILYGLHLAGPFKTAVFPFDVVSHNINLSHIAKEYDGLIVGGAHFGRISISYLETRNGNLLAIDRESENVVHQWDDFDGFFTSEFNRLDEIFDENVLPPKDYEKRGYS